MAYQVSLIKAAEVSEEVERQRNLRNKSFLKGYWGKNKKVLASFLSIAIKIQHLFTVYLQAF
jgi:hypothetical protein